MTSHERAKEMPRVFVVQSCIYDLERRDEAITVANVGWWGLAIIACRGGRRGGGFDLLNFRHHWGRARGERMAAFGLYDNIFF